MTLPADGSFSDVTSTLDYDLTDDAPAGAIARIDYQYDDRLVGQAYLEVSVTQGYVPGAAKTTSETADSGNSSEKSPESSAESVQDSSDMTKETANGSDRSAVNADSGTSVSKGSKKSSDSSSSWTSSPALRIAKKVLIVLAVIGVIGGSIFGIMIYQENKAQNERILRHQRREKRLKEWGYSSTEFDMIMENHLRSKAGITKPGFWERVKAHFKRH